MRSLVASSMNEKASIASSRTSRWSATSSVALLLPDTVFAVGDEPDACRLSDDFWISHFFHRANISLEGLPRCRLGSVLSK